MVSLDSPSRAGSLALVGGELALDFANTSSGRGTSGHLEHLRRAEDVADWAGHARVILPDDADWLRGRVGGDGALAEDLLGSALDLREHIYVIASELAAGRLAPQPSIDSLTKAHARCVGKAHLKPFERQFFWTWSPRQDPVEAALGPVALSAMTTLMQADLTRVKQCQGEKCGWLFFDTTKNKSRRWCEMEVCGNRAKQKRLTQRALKCD
ncbi:MAG: CGNR zinc finger domain-containing protein [Ancalomicrobiaceae bacterium]|nr:CGNR zinc finger domain-containing protein [Ancalomicrobiaceae bacterium]